MGRIATVDARAPPRELASEKPAAMAGFLVTAECTTAQTRQQPLVGKSPSGANFPLTSVRLCEHASAMNENITWQQRINELVDANLTIGEIAKLVGIKPPGLCDIRSGKTSEPKGFVAVKLYKLHLRRCKRAA